MGRRRPGHGGEASSDAAALLNAARRGDSTALEELYVRHHQRALTTAASFATFDYPPEDLAADAITQMLQALARGGGPTSTVDGYLTVTIRNLAASASRRRSHQAHPLFVDPDKLRDAALRPDDHDHPHQAALAAESRRELAGSLAKVHPRARSVLALLYLESMTIQECAHHLGIAPDAVRALAYRARKAMRHAHIAQASPTPS
jgi:RNA polymerase sigma factor (sigma-70 family)